MGDYQDGDRIYATHWLSMKRAIAGDVIVTGVAVTETSPASMSVDVSAGHYYQNGTKRIVGATNIPINASDTTNARLDLISGGPAGLVYTPGIPALITAPPDLPAGHIAIAMIYVPANSTTVVQANIREFAFPSPFREHSAQHEDGGDDIVVPAIHGARHGYGLPDELKVEDLATTEFDTTKILQPGGAGQLVWNEKDEVIEVAIERVYDGAGKTRNNKVTKLYPFDWDAGTPIEIAEVALVTVEGVEFSPNGQFVACGNKIYSLSGKTVKTFHTSLYGSSENTFRFSPCGRYVASKFNTYLMLYTIQSDRLVLQHQFDTGLMIGTLLWTPDGRFLIVSDSTTNIDCYEILANQFMLRHIFSGNSTPITLSSITPDGDMYCWYRDDTKVISFRKLYQHATSGVSHNFATSTEVKSIAWHPTGNLILSGKVYTSGGFASFLQRRDRNTGTPTGNDITHFIHAGTILSIVWSPNGKMIAVCLGINDNVRVYDYTPPNTFTIVHNIALPTGSGQVGKNAMAWSADQQYIALGTVNAGSGVCTLHILQTTKDMPAEGLMKTIEFRRGVDE